MKTSADLRARLKALHLQTAETPIFNPVFQLSLDLSRQIENGGLPLGEVAALVDELECEALESRAGHVRDLLAPVAKDANLARLREIVAASATDFESFAARWSRPLLHAVFTAHPTFLLSPAQSDAIAEAVSQDDGGAVCAASRSRPAITLDFEHDEAMAAIGRAAQARDALTGVVLDVAVANWPDRWTQLLPQPYRLATWVGYDMDGRTDISWSTSLRYRLSEKALRLSGYATQLAAIDPVHPLIDTLRGAEAHSRDMADRFARDLSTPEALSDAANALTAAHPDKIITLAPLIDQLVAEAASAAPDVAKALLVLASAMRADGLGMGDQLDGLGGGVAASPGDHRHPTLDGPDAQLDHAAVLVMAERGGLAGGADRHQPVGAAGALDGDRLGDHLNFDCGTVFRSPGSVAMY